MCDCHSGCLDMVAVEGQFTFTAEHPQLSCAAFFIAEPNEVISVDYNSVDIDCRGGDFITVNSPLPQNNIYPPNCAISAPSNPSGITPLATAVCLDNSVYI